MKLTESQALNRSAAYCSRAERSESDVRKKLAAWELDAETQKRIIDRLKKEKFLDKRRFVRSFIKDKVRFNKWGKAKIVFELRKKGVDQCIVDECLLDIDSSDLDNSLRSILKTKMKSVKANSDYERKAKLVRFAAGRGFSIDQIMKVLNEIMDGDDEGGF